MNIKLSMAISVLSVAAAVAFSTACESPTRLASRIDGTWSTSPEKFNKEVVGQGTYIPVLEFSRPDKRPEGAVILTAQLSITMPVNAPLDSMGAAPVSATAAGMATISGIWTANDDDEVKIALDPATLDITMDPDVQFAIADVFTDYDTDSVSAVSPQVMRAFAEQARQGMTDVIAHFNELDDIKFQSDAMFTAKLNSRRLTFAKSQRE